MLPSLPSRVTWETSDFSVGTVRLRVWKSTSPVEPTGSKRLIIGRSRSRRLPSCRTIAFHTASAASTCASVIVIRYPRL